MPWRECSKMDERLRFVARLLEGEKMARAVSGVRYLAQDWLQDLQSIQGHWPGGADGSESKDTGISDSMNGGRGMDAFLATPSGRILLHLRGTGDVWHDYGEL